ncbi:MAG: hypothetical protein ACTHK0_10350 [Ginsengibacter sp.]
METTSSSMTDNTPTPFKKTVSNLEKLMQIYTAAAIQTILPIISGKIIFLIFEWYFFSALQFLFLIHY